MGLFKYCLSFASQEIAVVQLWLAQIYCGWNEVLFNSGESAYIWQFSLKSSLQLKD